MYKYYCLRWRLSLILNSKTKRKKERKKGVVEFRLGKLRRILKEKIIRYSSGSDKLLLMIS